MCWFTSNAAGEALKKIQEQVTCEICAETFRDPRLLDCLHVYCRQCLDDLTINPIALVCPSCRRTTHLNAPGATNLLPAYHIHTLLKFRNVVEKVAGEDSSGVRCDKCRLGGATAFCTSCWQYVCGECTEIHKLWRELASHELVTLSNLRDNPLQLLTRLRTKAPLCLTHGNRELGVYCESCEKLVCVKCLSQQRHRGHACVLVADAFESQRSIVEGEVRMLKSRLVETNEAVLRFPPRLKEISDQRAELEDQIRETIRELHADLELSRVEFLAQLRQLAQQKHRTLGAQRRDAEAVRASLERALVFANQYLRAGREKEVVAVSAMVVRYSDNILAETNVNSLVPLERADMVFRPSRLADACAPCTTAVRTTCVSPSHCRIFFADPSSTRTKAVTLVCGDTATFEVVIRDESDEEFIEPVEITATLTVQGVAGECAIEKTGLGHYNIRCLPEITGRGILNVCVSAQLIGGCPVPIVVRNLYQKVGEPIMVVGGLKLPHGIVSSIQANMLIVENSLSKVSIFTAFGTRIRAFGSFGSAPGQFNDPDGITVDGSDNILVVDSGNHRIQKFTAEGEFITTVGTKGDGPLQFNLPTNIRIHPQTGNVYVCDQYNHRVQIMKEDFSFVGSFGREGNQDGDLLYPTDLAFDSSGCVHVVDSGNKRIQVYTRSGRYLGQYSDKGTAGSLAPYSICIDIGADRVYVGEYTHCISMFTSLGRFVGSFGKRGSGPGDFASPCRVAMHTGLIFVSDCSNGRVQIHLNANV